MSHLTRLFVFTLTIAIASGNVRAQTNEEVTRGIERLKDYFYRNFNSGTADWELMMQGLEKNAGEGAITSFVLLSLLKSGESINNNKIATGIETLYGYENNRTYGQSLRCHVWSLLPQTDSEGKVSKYRKALESDARWLWKFAANKNSVFSYEPRSALAGSKNTIYDHSNTHYGILGLWEASKRGVKVPQETRFWERAVQHWLSKQEDNGGWRYDENDKSSREPYGAMTAAGVTVLLIAQQELYREALEPDPRITKAIERGMQFLHGRFNSDVNLKRDGQTAYYYYALERVALANGVRMINNLDWYKVGAKYFLDNQRSDGSIRNNPVESCFALLFLSRGNVPVWASKLSLPVQTWANRPNDLYYLTEFFSSNFEGEFNWQIISLNDALTTWMSAPVVFLSSQEAMDWQPDQKARLKDYIDHGGTLIATPERGSKQFTESIIALAKELYPNYEFKSVSADHPILKSPFPLPENAGEEFKVLTNGARILMVLAKRDWSYTFQAQRIVGDKIPLSHKIASNIFAYFTERGQIPNRMEAKFTPQGKGNPQLVVKIGRVKHSGDWDVEPKAWTQLGNQLFNSLGIKLDTSETVELARLGASKLPLVHLTGTEKINFSGSEQAAILRYVRGGGTVFIESIGGQSGFSNDLERKLQRVFRSGAKPLEFDHPIVTAEGLSAGYDNKRVKWRATAVAKLGPSTRNRLAVYDYRKRPCVILSNEDLSMAAMNIRQSNIVGYSPDSARKLLANMLIWISEQK